MNWTYVLTPPAQRDLRGLQDALRRRVLQAIRSYTSGGRGDVVKLRGRGGEWRLRVGDYRVRFLHDYPNRRIVVLSVLHRRGAYRE